MATRLVAGQGLGDMRAGGLAGAAVGLSPTCPAWWEAALGPRPWDGEACPYHPVLTGKLRAPYAVSHPSYPASVFFLVFITVG